MTSNPKNRRTTTSAEGPGPDGLDPRWGQHGGGALAARIRAEMQARWRDGFRDLLVDFLAAAPSAEQIQTFARKHPDRWVQGVAMLAPLAGYSGRREGPPRLVPDLARLSDAELEQRLRELQAEIEALTRGQIPLPAGEADTWGQAQGTVRAPDAQGVAR